jgi:NaMN:DMB phosphoribosyltransferase
VAVITTKWVAYDVNAGAAMLAELVGAPFAAACPNFRRSRHPGLRAYEDGHVKEGAGAGGSMAAAHLTAGASELEIVEAVDKTYDELVLGIR